MSACVSVPCIIWKRRLVLKAVALRPLFSYGLVLYFLQHRPEPLKNMTMVTGSPAGSHSANGAGKATTSPAQLVQAEKDKHDLVLKTFRILIADLCQQFNGGHPG